MMASLITSIMTTTMMAFQTIKARVILFLDHWDILNSNWQLQDFLLAENPYFSIFAWEGNSLPYRRSRAITNNFRFALARHHTVKIWNCLNWGRGFHLKVQTDSREIECQIKNSLPFIGIPFNWNFFSRDSVCLNREINYGYLMTSRVVVSLNFRVWT